MECKHICKDVFWLHTTFMKFLFMCPILLHLFSPPLVVVLQQWTDEECDTIQRD